MAKTILHKAATRGHAAHGWLDSHHTFSFAGYYNADRMNFGVLRVLNDDIVAGGRGFDTHPHDNMEIISIPLEGDLEHKDNMGNKIIIKQGDIQVMSTGTGVFHSEYNANKDRPAKFLQIWVFPDKLNVQPRYDQITPDLSQKNQFHQILSPYPDDAGTWIYQAAWFNLGRFDKDFTASYYIQKPGNGVYAFVIKGKFNINGQELDARDGFGIWDTDNFSLTALESDAEILLMDVPLKP